MPEPPDRASIPRRRLDAIDTEGAEARLQEAERDGTDAARAAAVAARIASKCNSAVCALRSTASRSAP